MVRAIHAKNIFIFNQKRQADVAPNLLTGYPQSYSQLIHNSRHMVKHRAWPKVSRFFDMGVCLTFALLNAILFRVFLFSGDSRDFLDRPAA
jgi:hypothetical protein